MNDLGTILISFAGAIRKETLALGTNDPSYEVQPLFSPAKQAIEALIQEQVKEAYDRGYTDKAIKADKFLEEQIRLATKPKDSK